MKVFIMLCMLLPVMADAQKLAVLDPRLQKPAVYVSKASMDHLLRGNFVIERSNIPAVIETIQTFRSLIDKKDDIPTNMNSVIKGSTYFTASGEKGDYSIVLDTKVDKMGSYYVLVGRKDSRSESLAAIDRFVAYLEKAQ